MFFRRKSTSVLPDEVVSRILDLEDRLTRLERRPVTRRTTLEAALASYGQAVAREEQSKRQAHA